MQALIQFFFELCLLRRAPQDLPASSAFLGVTLAADLLAGVILGATVGISPGIGLAQSLADVVLMLVLLYGALSLLDRLPRFQQTATALLGSGALLGFIGVVPLTLVSQAAEDQSSGVAVLLFIGLIAWGVLVAGHILRHTFDLRLGQGVGIAVVYNFFAYTVVGGLFSGT